MKHRSELFDDLYYSGSSREDRVLRGICEYNEKEIPLEEFRQNCIIWSPHNSYSLSNIVRVIQLEVKVGVTFSTNKRDVSFKTLIDRSKKRDCVSYKRRWALKFSIL